MATFGQAIPKPHKRASGRTAVSNTPLTIRSRIPFGDDLDARLRTKLGRALQSMGTRIERMTVRFEDVNGPRGGIDTVCRMKVVLSGSESVLCEERGRTAEEALTRAVPRLSRAVRRSVDRRGGRAPAPTRPGDAPEARGGKRARAQEPVRRESLIGRTVGRHARNLARALERPEKIRRDAYVDTAEPGTSASDRRAGGDHTARRNTKKSKAKATATLEDSLTKPSRKSSRRATNRAKAAIPLTARAQMRASAPAARHARGK